MGNKNKLIHIIHVYIHTCIQPKIEFSVTNLEVFAVILADRLVLFRRLVDTYMHTYIYSYIQTGIRLGRLPWSYLPFHAAHFERPPSRLRWWTSPVYIQYGRNKQLLPQLGDEPDLLNEFLPSLLRQGRDIDADYIAVVVRCEVQAGGGDGLLDLLAQGPVEGLNHLASTIATAKLNKTIRFTYIHEKHQT